MPRSQSKKRSQTKSLVVVAIARYSISVEKWKTIVCFLFFHEIRLAKKNIITSSRMAGSSTTGPIIITISNKCKRVGRWKQNTLAICLL